MPQFFIKSSDVVDNIVTVDGENFNHLVRVRRVHEGSRINLRTDQGMGLEAEVIKVGESSLNASVYREYTAGGMELDLSVGIAVTKGGNFEFSIRKAVEVGVNRIIPLISERTIPDISKKIDTKMNRWGKIVAEASKQCMRSSVPVLDEPLSFMKLIDASFAGEKILAHPGAPRDMKEYMRSCEKPDSAALLIGPEGGFSDREISAAGERDWQVLNFGATHMRAETASIVIPSVIIYEWN